jgi:hypothetical protein
MQHWWTLLTKERDGVETVYILAPGLPAEKPASAWTGPAAYKIALRTVRALNEGLVREAQAAEERVA